MTKAGLVGMRRREQELRRGAGFVVFSLSLPEWTI